MEEASTGSALPELRNPSAETPNLVKWLASIPLNDALGNQVPFAEHYLVIDGERNGSGYNNPVTGAGWFIGPVDPTTTLSTIKAKGRVALSPLPGQVDDPVTMNEFWAKYPQQLKWFQENARTPEVALSEMRDFFLVVYERVGPEKITLVSDNHEMDLGRLSHLGWAAGVMKMPLRFFESNVYHSACDPGERFDMLTNKEKKYFKSAWLPANAPDVVYTHFPDDDAEYLYYKMLYCDQKKKERQAMEDAEDAKISEHAEI